MKKKAFLLLKFLLLIAIVIAIFFLVQYFNLTHYLDIAYIQEKVAMSGIKGIFIFGAVYIVSTVLFLPATPLTIASGALFGSLLGTLYVVLSATIGASIAFLISRFFGEGYISNMLKNKFPGIMEYDERLEKNGFSIVVLLRLIPLFPFNGLNFALGLTKVKFSHFFVATLVGIAPGSFVLANAGKALSMKSVMEIVIAIIIFLAFMLATYIYKKLHNHMSKNEFDIIVVGAGSGGLNIAMFMNKVGFKVLLVDKSDANIGGDCLNFGCVPSKALIHVARLVKNESQLNDIGLRVEGKVDMKKVIDYIKQKQGVIREHENAEYFTKLGITIALGEAKFVSKKSIEVNKTKYTGKKMVLATGSRPRILDIPGIKKAKVFTNETIFDIDFLPKKLVVIGGGPIGLELGQAFSHLGSKVTVIHRGSSLLDKEDPAISQVLINRLQHDKIKVYLQSSPTKVIDGKQLVITDANGDEHEIACDALLTSVGRTLNTNNLNLAKAKITVSDNKIKVNKFLQTTNKRVYLCGDVVGQHQFTHAAELHAGLILRNFFAPFRKKLNTDHLSWVTYTTPEIATFGMNEGQLKTRNIKYKKLETDFTEDDRAIVDSYTDGKLQILIDKKGQLLGGSMVAPNAGELIQELILANSAGLNIKSIFNKIYPYPTATRINKRVVSSYFADKLTPFAKKLLKIMYH